MARTTKDELQQFSSDFQAQTGKVIEDFSASVDNFFEDEENSTFTKLVGGLAGINQTASEEEILVNYVQKGTFKVGFPKAVRDFPESVQEALETILEVLTTLKTVLETIQQLIIGLSDLIASLLQSIFDTLEDLISMFTSVDAKVRVLPIPPINPSNTKVNNHTVADMATTLAFTALIYEAYGDTKISKAYPRVDMNKVETLLLGNSGPNARYKDGSTGFLSAINDSFDDTQDPNRPTEETGFSGGLVIHAGAPTVSIHAAWLTIKKILFNLKNELEIKPVRGPWPTANINSLEHIGFSERGWPLLQIEVVNPNHRAPKDLMSSPTEVYLPVELLVLGAHNTEISKYKVEQEGGFVHLDNYKGINGTEKFSDLKNSDFFFYSKKYEENLNSTELSALGLSAFKEQRETFQFELNRDLLTLNTANVSNLTPIDALFKVIISYKKFTQTTSGEYKEEYFDESIAPKYFSLSQSSSVHITLDPNEDFLPVIPAGAAPNWIQYGKTWQVPGTEKIVEWLRNLLDDLKSILSTTTNYLTSIINTYIKLIERLTVIVTRLSNIVHIIDKLLNTSVGANIVIFTCDNGVAGIKKAINDHYSEQQKLYAEARSNNTSTDGIDWFADGESVCGGVIVATSKTLEQVDRLISLLTLLFGSSSEQDTSGQGIISSEVLGLDPQSLELRGITSEPEVPKELFTDNFTGINSDRHSESPENTCDL